MNERIRQLALEAGEYVNSVYTPPVRSKTPGKIWEDGHIGWMEQFHAKFAELIIHECLNIVGPDQHQRAYPDSYLGGYDGLELLENRVAKVRQHFGIS